MALRRPHRKSRHGCAECKRRRVKCDEVRPACSNCSKRQSECEYDSIGSIAWAYDLPRFRQRSPASKSEGPQQTETSPGTVDAFGILGQLNVDVNSAGPPATLNFSNLELMVQWCNSTYQSYSRNERTDHIVRSLFPEEALSQPLLMHGILSLSALHLARMRNDQRQAEYLSTAVCHQNQALALFREFLPDINASNSKAMFAFASLVVIYAFGFPHTPDWKDPWTMVDDLIQVFILCRGVQQVLNTARSAIRNSNFAPLLQLDELGFSLPEDTRQALERLRQENYICGDQDASHDTELYNNTIDKLEDMMSRMYGGLNSMTASCRWVIQLDPGYVDMLREHKPLALVILAHYCIALHFLQSHWCLSGWSSRVSKAIWLLLDKKWKPLARWAVAEIHGQDFSFVDVVF